MCIGWCADWAMESSNAIAIITGSELMGQNNTLEGGRWRPRRNSELYSLYSEPNIVEDIKIRRLG